MILLMFVLLKNYEALEERKKKCRNYNFSARFFIYMYDEVVEHGVVEKFVAMRRQCNSITHSF